MNAATQPALETLLLACSPDSGGIRIPHRILFLGATPHPAFSHWSAELTGWQPQKPSANAWDRAGFQRVDEIPDLRWPLVMILPGKAREEILSMLALARDHLEPGGTILVALPNTAGAGRYEKEFSAATGAVGSIQKHKCRAFFASDNGSWNEDVFRSWRQLAAPTKIPGTGFFTQPGIFSAGHIDPGSQFLADQLPANLRGHFADLGAGWGFLSASALESCPEISNLDLFEADSRALACARQNLSQWMDDREIGFHWHDVTQGVPGTYDGILMNPPFHTGQASDPDLGRAFIRQASAALRRGGILWLVANRQLPYEATLESSGLPWKKVAENPTYKVLSARKS